MYKPMFNHVLVEIDDADAKWGKSNDGSLTGDVYREGKVVDGGWFHQTPDHDVDVESIADAVKGLIGRQIMWNEGHEAGTVFEEDGKKYCLIYWWDIIGVKEDS